MMNKKYAYGVVMLTLAVIVVFLVRYSMIDKSVTGKKTEETNESVIEEKTEETDVDEEWIKSMDYLLSCEEFPTYPAGKLEDIKYKFLWNQEPEEDVYDPDNRVARNGAYGRTISSNEMKGAIEKELGILDSKAELDDEHKGRGKYCTECVKNPDVKFEIKKHGLNGIVKNIHLVNDISELKQDEKYFSMGISDFKEAFSDDEKCVVMADITMECTTDWIEEAEVVPTLVYLDSKGDYLELIQEKEGENGKYPEYYNLGLYNQKDKSEEINVYLCPMRKEESISFNVAYIVDKEYLKNAYLFYETSCYIENDYLNKYNVFVPMGGAADEKDN